MRLRPSLWLAALLPACLPAFEDADSGEPEPPSQPRFDPPAESDVEPAAPTPLPKTVEKVAQDVRRKATARCEGGKVHGPGGCERCVQDEQCGGACNLETARCDPTNWCQADEHCASYESCDEGLCIYRTAQSGRCGVGPIHFAWDSATVTSGSKARLEAAVDCLAGTSVIYVEAHADEVGTEEYNILLAERRGHAVRNALSDAGLPRGNLYVIAKGSLEATGTNAEGYAADRRVVLLAADGPGPTMQ